MKQTGILLAISSLPSPYGVGDLGNAAIEWVDCLKENHLNLWQILPFHPLGFGNSPYQPYSSFAGDELYISLELLAEQGLLKTAPPPFRPTAVKVDYEAVRNWKENWLKQAFETFEPNEQYVQFIGQDWVKDYAVFRALKQHYNGKCWVKWNEEHRNWAENGKPELKEFENAINYHLFLQYTFFDQWHKVKEYANKNGISIMGDVPFYVGLDSADVWAGKKNFLLDKDGHPRFIAGVPPDYFSATGQRWGNPIYDWEQLEKENFAFWVKRIGTCQKEVDYIRIDHFRAFDTFWKIPASCPTAIEGEWIEAPGYQVLDTLYREIPNLNLVAEDLGDMRPEVYTLRDHYHLKGMVIMEFMMDTSGKYLKDHSPKSENRIYYTGTHDNATLVEWYRSLTKAAQRKLRRWLKQKGYANGSVAQKMLQCALDSHLEFVILPLQDVMYLSASARMNTPGTVGSPNWEWKLQDFESAKMHLKKLRAQIRARGEQV